MCVCMCKLCEVGGGMAGPERDIWLEGVWAQPERGARQGYKVFLASTPPPGRQVCGGPLVRSWCLGQAEGNNHWHLVVHCCCPHC
jgi:hypothetical protein